MDREYTYYEFTESICEKCMKVVPAKIVFKQDKVYLLKQCKEHGELWNLLEDDIEYFINTRKYDKPGTISQTQTTYKNGCPYDCGLCTEHDQHSCIYIIEITQACNMNCSMCYAKTSRGNSELSLEKIEEMLDFAQDAENKRAEILQISGGEPTMHSLVLEIIQMAKDKHFKYVMLNTNGKRIAEDEYFAKSLSEFIGGFEVYLQFDAVSEKYEALRGEKMLNIKKKAIENLEKYGIPTTLVCTIVKGINDDEVGNIISYALTKNCIRGINFQPQAFYGDSDYDEIKRITLTKVLVNIEAQTKGMIKKSDFIPLPCNVERVAVNYMYRKGSEFIPIVREANIEKNVHLIDNTLYVDLEELLKRESEFSGACCCMISGIAKEFRKLIPANFVNKALSEKIKYINENTFRISVTSFVDKYNFDKKSIQKECVHVVTEDLRRIPFSAYNMIYRKKV